MLADVAHPETEAHRPHRAGLAPGILVDMSGNAFPGLGTDNSDPNAQTYQFTTLL